MCQDIVTQSQNHFKKRRRRRLRKLRSRDDVRLLSLTQGAIAII